MIFSIFLLGPLTTLVIVPATGETNFMFGFFLLKKIGDPNFTEAPSFKISFGAIPKKSFIYLRTKGEISNYFMTFLFKKLKKQNWKQRNPFKINSSNA